MILKEVDSILKQLLQNKVRIEVLEQDRKLKEALFLNYSISEMGMALVLTKKKNKGVENFDMPIPFTVSLEFDIFTKKIQSVIFNYKLLELANGDVDLLKSLVKLSPNNDSNRFFDKRIKITVLPKLENEIYQGESTS